MNCEHLLKTCKLTLVHHIFFANKGGQCKCLLLSAINISALATYILTLTKWKKKLFYSTQLKCQFRLMAIRGFNAHNFVHDHIKYGCCPVTWFCQMSWTILPMSKCYRLFRWWLKIVWNVASFPYSFHRNAYTICTCYFAAQRRSHKIPSNFVL